MRFKEFFLLRESSGYGTDAGKRTVPIDSATFLDLYKKNCKLYNPDTMKMFRGNHALDRERTEYAFCDPTKAAPRPSRNTQSFTMWLMENMDEWQKYPRRSQSLICSTTSDYAGSYGRPFMVIPYDTAKVGVCAAMDFFDTIEKGAGIDVSGYNSQISELIRQTIDLMRIHGKDKNIKSPPFRSGASSTYDDDNRPPATREHFFSLLKTFDRFFLQHPELIDSLVGERGYYSSSPSNTTSMIINGLSRKIPLADILSQNLSPEKNGFELFDMHNFDTEKIPNATGSWGYDRGNEVWTDGPALFVKENTFEKLLADNVQY